MLQTLIKQSWVLILLLIAIPTAVWKMLQKEEPDIAGDLKPVNDNPSQQKPQPEAIIEKPNDKPVYASISKRPPVHPIHYQTEAVILPDSVPFMAEESQEDTLIFRHQPIPPSDDMPHLTTKKPAKSSSWNIQLAYSGQTGQRDKYLTAANISQQSFASASNSFIPTNYSFSNWIDYS